MKKLLILISVLFLLSLVSVNAITDDDLIDYGVALFSFENNLEDDSPAGIDAEVYTGSPTYNADGKMGGCYEFTASADDALNISYTARIPTTDMLICTWVNLTTATENLAILFKAYGPTDTGFLWYARHTADKQTFRLYPGDVDAIGTDIRGDGWTHLCAVYNTTHGRVYENSVGTTPAAFTATLAPTLPLYIGTYDKDNQYNIDGKVDELYFFNTSFRDKLGGTQAVIDYLYAKTTRLTSSTPTLSNINCTSNPDGDTTEPYNSTGDKTPTFNFDTNINANCDISDSDTAHWTDCGTTGTTSHICTLPFEYILTSGTDYMYVNCTNSSSAYDTWEVWTEEVAAVIAAIEGLPIIDGAIIK